jgi:hypothetical protein
MKNLKITIPIIYTLACILIVLTGGCKKSVDGFKEDPSQNRSFTPSRLSVGTVRDSVRFTWTAPLYAQFKQPYTLDISTDSTFVKVDYSILTDTTGAVMVDPNIKLNTIYFARVKANAYNGVAESPYLYNLRSFRLLGQQYIRVIRDFEITNTTVLIHWFINDQTTGLTSLVFTPTDGSAPITTTISAADIPTGQKLVTGLTPNTRYTVQLLAGQKSKGIVSVTTSQAVTFTTTISPGANLTTVIAAAADGDVIGLNPGTYTFSGIYQLPGKSITLRSVSNNPADTKILLREIDVSADGGGITMAGLDINGNYSGTTFSAWPIVFIGTTAVNGAAANFKNIKLDNCVIHDFSRGIIRANSSTIANDQKMAGISINNCIFYNMDQTNTGGYYMISLEKLQIFTLSITKSTFYSVGEGMINMSTTLATPATAPTFSIDYCTLNNVGGNSKYLFIDAGANLVNFTFSNGIVANTPITGATIQAAATRNSITTSTMVIANTDYFKTAIATGGLPLSFTGLAQNNIFSIDLGWTATTNNFLLVPGTTNARVFNGSSSGNTVGDPRWAY